MTIQVRNDFCPKVDECKIAYDIMWGGYECHACGKIGWLGLVEGGKSALYNDPKAAEASIKRFKKD